MSVRTAIVVGVVVTVLLVAAFVVGGGQEQGSGADLGSLVDRLAGLAGDPASVDLDDVDASCVDDEDPLLLVVEDGLPPTCLITVRRDEPLGLLHLRALAPISIRAPAPQGDVVVTSEAAPDDDDEGEVTVAVGEGETSIVIRCLGLGPCAVRVVE